MNRNPIGNEEAIHTSSQNKDSFHTPFDDIIPDVEEPAAQFYLDAMRIYLGLCEGTVTMDVALEAVARLKENPEYITFPINPTVVPISQRFKMKMIENLKTLNKFNLYTKSSIRSAYNFVFLVEDAPISTTDFSVLSALSKNPRMSLVSASDLLNLTPRTIARSLDRLIERNALRVSILEDTTAFNLQSVMLFFVVQEGIEWALIEQGLQQFPFTKSILKTTMTDVGYVTFLIPNYEKFEHTFKKKLHALTKTIFSYASLHIQTHVGTTSNVDLLQNDTWELPKNLEYMLKSDREIDSDSIPPLIRCSGVKPEFDKDDFVVTAQFKLDARALPGKISENLMMKGWDIDSRKVSSLIRRLQNHNLFHPYIIFALPRLSSNFCFEIICNNQWKPRILETLGKFPWVMYYLSDRGIIVWTMTPGEHQVEYYQLFRALEQKPGITSVQPIMTISQQGSRSMLDLTKNISLNNGIWSIDEDDVDIGKYMEF
ncbi:MAG: winged helix-turn-helix domain-containing protein [Candidatus Thorarchaeota archaeon]